MPLNLQRQLQFDELLQRNIKHCQEMKRPGILMDETVFFWEENY
jgi:hypothetical protein